MVDSKTITLDGLRFFVSKLCKEQNLNDNVQNLLIEQVDRLGEIYGKNIDRHDALQIIAKQIDVTQTGFIRDPIGVQEFVESPEYMNQGLYVRPPIMDHLIRLFEDQDKYHVVVLGGAIGIGKNYFADMAVAYMLYRMSCLYSPQSYYGLAPGSSIVYSFQSKTLSLARKVVFTQFSARLQSSSFFQRHFPFSSSYKAELKFPHGISIVPISGSDTSALGMNIFTAIIDELNFMGRVKKSRLSQFTGEEEYDQAEKLYQTVEQRLKSRFRLLGKVPGKIFLISSSNYDEDFIDRKIKEAKTDPNIFVMKLAQWESLDPSKFCGKKFYVTVPTTVARGSIMMEKIPATLREDGYEYTEAGQRLLTIPIEYHQEFSHDLDNSLRNCAGIALPKRGKFIESSSVQRAMDAYLKYYRTSNQIFKLDHASYDEINTKDISSLLNPSFIRIVQNEERFGAHIDLGYTGDAVGISIGTVVGLKDIGSKTVYDQETGKFRSEAQGHLPVYSIIGMLKIYPPMVGEIDLNFIRDVILHIGDILHFQFITLDKFQSVSMMQTFRAKGFQSSFLSVDKTPEAYLEVKNALREGRVLLPQSNTLKEEMDGLEQDREKGKVDHSVGKQKDLSDSVAGTIYNFSLRRKSYSGFVLVDGKEPSERTSVHIRRSSQNRPSSGRPSITDAMDRQHTVLSRLFNR